MLSGLMYNIGVLPLCQFIETNKIAVDDDSLAELISKCSRTIGTNLLVNWNFPQEIIDAVAMCATLPGVSSGTLPATYSDVVTVAHLLGDSDVKSVDWNTIPALIKLGLNAIECMTFFEINAKRIEQVSSLLGMKITTPAGVKNSSMSPPQVQATPHPPTVEKGGVLAFLLKLFGLGACR